VYGVACVQEPFANPTAQRYPLAEIAADLGAEVRRESFGWVDAEERVAHTDAGEALGYDALLLALGARPYVSLAHVVTVDDRRIDEQLHGLIQDVEGGYVKRLAFVAPGPATWPLPLYELALMTAQRAYETSAELEITLITPEERPLAVFGLGASHAVSKLLEVAGIQTIGSAHVQVPESQHLLIHPGSRRLEVDRIVALPALLGPAIRGLPSVAHGFIPPVPTGGSAGRTGSSPRDATDSPSSTAGSPPSRPRATWRPISTNGTAGRAERVGLAAARPAGPARLGDEQRSLTAKTPTAAGAAGTAARAAPGEGRGSLPAGRGLAAGEQRPIRSGPREPVAGGPARQHVGEVALRVRRPIGILGERGGRHLKA